MQRMGETVFTIIAAAAAGWGCSPMQQNSPADSGNSAGGEASEVASTDGQVEVVSAPETVVPNENEGPNIRIFRERDDYELPNSLQIEASEPGTYDRSTSLPGGEIPAGTEVDVFYVHADTPDNSSRSEMRASIEFSASVAGVVATDDAMLEANEVLKVDDLSTTYPDSADGYGVDVVEYDDSFEIGPDRKSVSMKIGVKQTSDSMRIVLADVDAQPSPTKVTATEGQVEQISPPETVVPNENESSDIRVFRERTGYELPSNLETEAREPGTYDKSNSLPGGEITAGTRVDSFYVHADAADNSSTTRMQATLEFDRPIAGVVATDEPMVAANDVLKVDSLSTEYPGDPEGYGVDVVEYDDSFTIGSDRKSISLDIGVKQTSDSMRVIFEY